MLRKQMLDTTQILGMTLHNEPSKYTLKIAAAAKKELKVNMRYQLYLLGNA